MKAVHAVVVLLMAFGLIAHAETNIRFAPDIEKSAGAEDLVALRAGLEKTVRPRLMAATASSKSSGTTVTATGDLGYVRGRGSLYFYFDVPATLKSVTSARVSMNSYDVDYPSAIEHDKVYFNGTYIGRLQGYNNGWEINTFAVPASSVKIGQSNTMRIDVDVENTGWVTGSKDIVLYLNGEEGEIGLSASNGLKNRIDLSWTVNFSGTTFNVYRGSTPESLAIYQEGLTEMSFSDTSVNLGETYYYQVMSRTGISSGIVEGRCQDGSITLLATTAYYHEIRLMWNPDNCEGPYTIYRGSRVDDLAPLAYDVDDMSYTDDSIGNGESFYYRVVAANGIVSDVVKGTGKQQEIEITYDPNIPDAIRLDWTTTGPAPEYYTIVRLNAEGEVNAVFENVTEPHYCDVTALPDQSYKYEVKFKDVEGSVNVKNSLKDFPKVDSWELIPDSDVEHPNKPLVAGDVASVDIKLREYDKLHYRVVAAALIGRKVVQTETNSNTNRKRNVKQPSPEGHLLLWISDEHKGDQNEILSLLGVNPIPTVWENDPNSTLTRLSTFASMANFFRGETPRDGVFCRESSRIAFANAV